MENNTDILTEDQAGTQFAPVVNEEPINNTELEEAKEFARRQLYLGVLKGIRPPWLDQKTFKELRAGINKQKEGYLKGKWFHKANWDLVGEDDKKEVVILEKGNSYIKNKEVK